MVLGLNLLDVGEGLIKKMCWNRINVRNLLISYSFDNE